MDSNRSRALVLLADGAEEMEVTIVVDVLRRGGIDVVLAGLAGPDPVTCSRDVRLVPDCSLDDVSGAFDCIVLPGGAGGSEALAASRAVGALLADQQLAAGRVVAAICAAPAALAAHGIAPGTRMTSHPSVRAEVEAFTPYEESAVVVDGDVITSRGPGTAFAFAFAIIERLRGAEVVDAVRAPMMFE